MTKVSKEQVFVDYNLKVRNYILGKVNNFHLAEDLCSEVFDKIYDKLDTFNSKKASLSTWVFTIARNTLIDYYRTRKVNVEIPDNLVYEQDDDDTFSEEDLNSLALALEKLDKRSKRIVVSYYYENKTLKKIAEDLGISYAYVKILHKKALLDLRKYIKI